jgi:sporulation protein YlmC with PRC-barrel domain
VKGFAIMVLSASLVLPLAVDVGAQTRTAPRESDQKDRDRQTWMMPQGAVESKKVIGARIKDASGKDIGEIEQLIVSQNDGKVTHAVIGAGGLAGVGEKKVVVPWSDVKMRQDGNKWVATLDKATLDQAPRFESRESTRERSPSASPSTTAPREERKSY